MTIQLKLSARNVLLQTLYQNLTLSIYDGTMPATVDTAETNTILLSHSSSPNSMFIDNSTGIASVNSLHVGPHSILVTGTATHWRLLNSLNQAICQGTVTATAGGGDMECSTVSFVAGQTATITSWTITAPGA